MGLVTGEEELVSNVEVPKKTNPINDEVVLATIDKGHYIASRETVANKRPWFDDLTQDMYASGITELEGSKIYAEFFSMLTASDSIASGTSSLISAVHREYLQIHEYPIFLDGELNTNTDAVEQKTDTSSTATIGGVLAPNTGDYFILNTGINRRSVFKIMSVKPLSIYTDRTYQIEYIMEEVQTSTLYADLISKVVKTLNYIRENHQLGIKYLLTDDEVRTTIEDKLLSDNLFKQYTAEFYNPDLKVYGVKTHNGFHTDMIIQDFLSKLVRTPDDMYTYTEYEETRIFDTIFDVLLYLDKHRLTNVMDSVYYYRLHAPTDIGNIMPVLLSPITSMPFQKSSRLMKANVPNVVKGVIHQFGHSEIPEIDIDTVFDEAYVSNTKGFPNVLQNETYLLSEKFYAGGYGNDLEELLMEAILHRPLLRSRVVELVSQLIHLEHEERFFITPFVLALLKVARG